MELFEREFFVYRMLAGYMRYDTGTRKLKIKTPTIDTIFEGQEIYLETLRQAKEYEIADEKMIDDLLRERGLWSDYDEDQLKNVLPKHVEYWKVEIYNNFKISSKRKQLELHLKAARNGLNDLFSRKHMFDHYTQHGLATFARWQHITEASTVNLDGTPYDWSEVNVNGILEFISKNSSSEEIIREIARSEPWRPMWMASKRTGGNLFGKPAIELSEEQKRVINWSGQYDNVHEYPDCPSDAVFEHDDAFDGWMILKVRENEKNRNEEAIKKKAGPSSMDAPEVFIVMSDEDKEDPEKFRNTVYGMNDPTSRMIVNSRLQTVSKMGVAKDADFADVQRSVARDVNNLVMRSR